MKREIEPEVKKAVRMAVKYSKHPIGDYAYYLNVKVSIIREWCR